MLYTFSSQATYVGPPPLRSCLEPYFPLTRFSLALFFPGFLSAPFSFDGRGLTTCFSGSPPATAWNFLSAPPLSCLSSVPRVLFPYFALTFSRILFRHAFFFRPTRYPFPFFSPLSPPALSLVGSPYSLVFSLLKKRSAACLFPLIFEVFQRGPTRSPPILGHRGTSPPIYFPCQTAAALRTAMVSIPPNRTFFFAVSIPRFDLFHLTSSFSRVPLML